MMLFCKPFYLLMSVYLFTAPFSRAACVPVEDWGLQAFLLRGGVRREGIKVVLCDIPMHRYSYNKS
jgi:hypothetical protein